VINVALETRQQTIVSKSLRRKELDESFDLVEYEGFPLSWCIERLANLVDPRTLFPTASLSREMTCLMEFRSFGLRIFILPTILRGRTRQLRRRSRDPMREHGLPAARYCSVLLEALEKLGTVPDSWAGANIARAVARIKPIHAVNRDYLLIVLQEKAVQTYFTSTTRTLAQPTLNVGMIEQTPIPVPPLAEQRRIVEKVDQLLGLCDELAARQAAQREKRQRLVGATLDRLVSPQTSRHLACRGGLTASAPLDGNTTGAEANEPPGQARWRVMEDDAHRLRNHFDQLFDTPATIPQLRQTILQLAIQGQLVPQDPNDEPGEVLEQRVDDFFARLVAEKQIRQPESLPPVPTDYSPFPLPQNWVWRRLGTVIRIASGDGLTSNQMNKSGQIPVYGGNGVNGFHDLANVTEPTLVIGRVGFYCGSIHLTPNIAWVTDNAFITTFPKEAVDIEFLFWLLKATDLRENDNATAQPVISGKKVYPTILAFPPLAEQKRIVTKVTELLSLCDALEAKLTQAESASTQLLSAAVHHLLNGAVANVCAAKIPSRRFATILLTKPAIRVSSRSMASPLSDRMAARSISYSAWPM
jgi:restriction endonuclease S subunit